MTEDHWLSRLARLETHVWHIGKHNEQERSARISLRNEVLSHIKELEDELAAQRQLRQDLIVWVGTRALYLLAVIAGILASVALELPILGRALNLLM